MTVPQRILVALLGAVLGMLYLGYWTLDSVEGPPSWPMDDAIDFIESFVELSTVPRPYTNGIAACLAITLIVFLPAFGLPGLLTTFSMRHSAPVVATLFAVYAVGWTTYMQTQSRVRPEIFLNWEFYAVLIALTFGALLCFAIGWLGQYILHCLYCRLLGRDAPQANL